MKSNLYVLMAVVFLTCFASCKPTEQNYQNAYDLALNKRNQQDPDADLIYQGHKQLSPLGAVSDKISGVEVMTLRRPLKFILADTVARTNRWRVAEALYRMEANARANAEDLQTAKRSGVGVAKLGEEKYLLIVASFSNPADAVAYIDSCRKTYPDRKYIGLGQDEPLLIISPN